MLTVNLEKTLISQKRSQIKKMQSRLDAEENILKQANQIIETTSSDISGTLINAGFETAIKNADFQIKQSVKEL